jgi:uncharacterized membrane protein
MVDVITSIEIKRPCDQVSQYAANPDNVPDLYVNIKSIERRTLKPLQLGSQLSFKAEFLGKKLAYVYEVTEYAHEKSHGGLACRWTLLRNDTLKLANSSY